LLCLKQDCGEPTYNVIVLHGTGNRRGLSLISANQTILQHAKTEKNSKMGAKKKTENHHIKQANHHNIEAKGR